MSFLPDAYAKIHLPTTTAEWTAILDGTNVTTPSSYWLASQASGTTLPDLGTTGSDVTIAGSPTLGAAAPGFQATGIKCTDGSTTQYGTFNGGDVDADSSLLLTVWAVNSNPSATRRLTNFGDAGDDGTTLVTGTSGPKIGAVSDADSASGTANFSAIVVVVTKLDRANSVIGSYTRGEQTTATWSAPSAATTHYLFGHTSGSSDATFVYGAYWTGADAEMSDATIQDLIDAVYGDSTTLSAMQAGSMAGKLVAAIEGCEYLLCESHTAAALRAWAGSDWDSALPGLFVEIKSTQTLTPWEPFTAGGSCTLRIADADGSDAFGVLVNRRLAGAETELTETIDRNDTTIKVAATTDFTSSGVAFIGTEAVRYTGKTSTTLTGCTRGYWSPFGCATSGSGGNRFANHHRVGPDPNNVETRPIVSQLPRVWLGKRVGVWLHTWDEATQTMNSRDEAQLLYAGRIANIADDANTGHTVIDVEPAHEEIKNGVIGRDMMSATIAPGLYLVEGRVFAFQDWKFSGNTGSPGDPLVANPLTVVASGASGTNQMNAGRYTLGEICEKLSAWLAGEKAASRIHGFYSWQSPVSSNVGLRTKCYWKISDGDEIPCSFAIDMPGEVTAFLGLSTADPANSGQTERFSKQARTDTQWIAQGESVPFVSLIFKPLGPGRLAQEFSTPISYEIDDMRGGFCDQYSALPAVIKASCDPTKQWGLWMLNESALMVGSYEDGSIANCWLAPFQATADKAQDATNYIGRRADEPEGGPVTIRQIYILESSLATLFSTLVYGTGTPGYNHGTLDGLAYGFGLGIPGEMLGGDFERSLSSLPGADAPITVTIDEPTKFTEIFSGDLIVRRAFLRWKDEGFEFAQWKTPLAVDAVATLNESNKAAPVGHQENHRVATLETAEHARPVVKLDYARDFAVGRDGQYLKSVQIQDQTAVDDAGGSVKPYTIKLRNCYHDFQNAGAAVEGLIPEFLATMPAIGRPVRIITRSIDLRLFEGKGVGDIVNVADSFARDPLTGRRGIGSRPAVVTRISYDLGGMGRAMGGDIEAMFMDLHRSEIYAPAAEVDETATDAGYEASTKILTCHAHKYSHTIQYDRNWGRGRRTHYLEDDADATWFAVDDEINVIEMDPADPASPLMWGDTVAAQSGNTITLTTGLSGWDSTKKYRIVPKKYSEGQLTQQDYAYQADSLDRMIEDLDPFFHYAGTTPQHAFIPNTGLEKAELIPTIAYGDGRPQDPAYDRAIIYGLNAAIDYKTAHQSPMLWWFYGQSPSTMTDDLWSSLLAGPIFLGFEHGSSVITRSLTVAPYFRALVGGATTAEIRITLSRIKPQAQVSHSDGHASVTGYVGPMYPAEYSQTATWSTTSGTWQIGEEKTLSLNVKDLEWGYAWLVIEGRHAAICKGLAKCIEGPRTNTAIGNALLLDVATVPLTY